MKRIIFFLFSLLFIGGINAQDYPKSFGDFSFGLNLPYGDYASSDENNYDAGYAKTGMYLDLGVNYKIYKYLGFSFHYNLYKNAFNADDFQTQLYNSTGILYAISYQDWLSHGPSLGIYVSTESYKKFNCDLYFRVGTLSTNAPDLDISTNGDWLKIKSDPKYTFSFLYGFNFKYRFAEKMALTLKVGYNMAKLKYLAETTSYYGYSDLSEYEQKIRNLNVGLGIAFYPTKYE